MSLGEKGKTSLVTRRFATAQLATAHVQQRKTTQYYHAAFHP